MTHIGKLIARANSYDPIADTQLAADLVTLVTSFGTTWLPPEGIASFYGGLQNNITGWKQGLGRFCDSRLLDTDTVLRQLDAQLDPSTGIEQLLPAFMRQMVLDNATISACQCSVGTVTPLASNVGNGSAYTTLILDGFNAPLAGGISSLLYEGLQSQLCVPSEVMTLECVSDSIMDGVDAGDEEWQLSGNSAFDTLDWRTEGSGVGPTISTDNGRANVLSNAGFTQWSGGAPAGWTFTGGVQTGTAARFTGNGLLAFPVSSGQVDARRRYRLGILVKQTGATSGTLQFSMSSGESVSINCASIGASYGLLSVFVTMPAYVAGFSFEVTVAGLNGGASVYVTSPSLAPTTYFGGLGVNIAAGTTAWQRGDRLSWTVANDQAGAFQNFFRRWYKVQLPSVSTASQGTFLLLPFLLLATSGTESIPDSLVA